jgi:hypothetical protein
MPLLTNRSRISAWKVQASNDGITYTEIVSRTSRPSFVSQTLTKFEFPSDCTTDRYVYWRFCVTAISSSDTPSAFIHMLKWIPRHTFSSPERKCLVGYVPTLSANTLNHGFRVSASSEDGDNKAYKAFREEGEWIAEEAVDDAWLAIECPEAVRIWKVGLRGRPRNANIIMNQWRLYGSNGSGVWDRLYATEVGDIGSIYHEFLIDSVGKYQAYRLNCIWTGSEGRGLGLGMMQLFVYDE